MMKRNLTTLVLLFGVGVLPQPAAGKSTPLPPINKPGERSPASATPASNAPQGPAPAVGLPAGNRFLFVIENSLGTERIDQSLRQAFFDILYCGVRNHLQPGDTFGVWTFNATTCTEYPMQVWQPTNRLELTSRATQFVKGRGYAKQARPELLISDLVKVVRAARDVNILIFSDGNDKFKGTPFDRQINTFFKEKGREFRQRKDPFVITLIARGGELISWAVNQPVDLIARPVTPPPPTNLVATAIATPVTPLKKPAREPILITAAKKPPVPVPPEPTPTNLIAAPIVAVPTNASSSPVITNTFVTTASTNSIPSTVRVVAAETNLVTATTVTAKPVVTNAPAILASTNPASAFGILKPAPVPVAARERDSNAVSSSVIAAAALPPDPSPGPQRLFLAGLGLLAAALLLLVFLLRPSHAKAKSSAITESMRRGTIRLRK